MREEKKERKLKERLDFDFPSETARREAKDKAKGKGKAVEQEDGDERFRVNRTEREGEEFLDKSWDDRGHINFFQDIEQNVSTTVPLV